MPSYVTVAQAKAHRAFGGVVASDIQIADKLDAVETRVEKYCGVAFVPRLVTEHHIGAGTYALWLSHRPVRDLEEVEIDGVYADPADFVLSPTGKLRALRRLPDGADIAVTYEHGHETPPPDLLDAVLRAAATMLRHDGNPRVGERTDTLVGEGHTVNFAAVASMKHGRPFGMPDVDVVVNAHRVSRSVFA